MRRIIVTAVLIALPLATGCTSNNDSVPMAPGEVPVLVSPADGTQGVRLDAVVTLSFSGAVNRDVVERGVHLISERAIADSMCPDPARWSHPDMDHCMADSAMMWHLDADHSTRGRFSWNGNTCTFRPDSLMSPGTRHMIHMGREMTDMMGHRSGGEMMPHGSGSMARHEFMHFTTMDTTAD